MCMHACMYEPSTGLDNLIEMRGKLCGAAVLQDAFVAQYPEAAALYIPVDEWTSDWKYPFMLTIFMSFMCFMLVHVLW